MGERVGEGEMGGERRGYTPIFHSQNEEERHREGHQYVVAEDKMLRT